MRSAASPEARGSKHGPYNTVSSQEGQEPLQSLRLLSPRDNFPKRRSDHGNPTPPNSSEDLVLIRAHT